MSVEKINHFVVQPVPLKGGGDKRPVKGAALFPEIYANVFLCAKKQSGKSTVLYNIIDKCSGRDTKIIAFCSTLYKDNAWIMIRDLCKQRKLDFEGHTSLKEEGVDLIESLLISQAKVGDEEEEERSAARRGVGGVPPPKAKVRSPLLLDEEDDEEEEKKPTKYRAPEMIIVLDDLSDELKSKSVARLLKVNRHLKSKVIISSQYLHDLLPESRKQLDAFLVFGNMSDEKLQIIYKDADVGIEFDEFVKLYRTATKDKFSFLYIDTRNNVFRRNFNEKFKL